MRDIKGTMKAMRTVVLLLLLMNAILIREAYVWCAPLYWVLLVSVPLLLFAVQRLRAKSREQTKSLKFKKHETRK